VVRRLFLASVLVVALGAAACGPPGITPPPPETADGSRPNIVFFLTDDQSADQMSALPAVRELIAGRGTTFSNAIVPIPLCCPARASLVTGQYPHNHGVVSNDNSAGGGFAGLDQTNTLPRWLRNAGYRTAHVGKYMNGYGQSRPVPTGWDEWWATSRNPFLMYDYTLNHNGVETPFGFAPSDYKTDVITRISRDFVRTSAPSAQPFYLQVWYTAPHVETGTDSRGQTWDDRAPRPAPRHVNAYSTAPMPKDPSYAEADVSDKPRWVQNLPMIGASRTNVLTSKYRQQLAALASVDEGIRQIVDAVAAAGELDTTIFVFSSDNGYTHGEHRIAFRKSVIYEPSIKVPLFVAGPGFPRGVSVRTPVMFPDLAPAFLRLAGAPAGLTMDGTALQTWVARPDVDRVVLIGSGIDTIAEARFEGIRTRRWVYAEYPATSERELYDLSADPSQLVNRAGSPAYATVQAQLRNLFVSLRGCVGAACNVAVPAALA
jgi:arylsulfatase A-like enzyme